MERGRFIVFEGIDGAGKTTQVNLLAERLRALGKQVVITAEPTSLPSGRALREAEDNEDVLSQQGVDIAFLPVNQPYTMTVEQATNAIKAIKPTLFYPYHYGQVEEKTDINALIKALEGICEVRVFPME